MENNNVVCSMLWAISKTKEMLAIGNSDGLSDLVERLEKLKSLSHFKEIYDESSILDVDKTLSSFNADMEKNLQITNMYKSVIDEMPDYIDVYLENLQIHPDMIGLAEEEKFDFIIKLLKVKPDLCEDDVHDFLKNNYTIIQSESSCLTEEGDYFGTDLPDNKDVARKLLENDGWKVSEGYRHGYSEHSGYAGDYILLVKNGVDKPVSNGDLTYDFWVVNLNKSPMEVSKMGKAVSLYYSMSRDSSRMVSLKCRNHLSFGREYARSEVVDVINEINCCLKAGKENQKIIRITLKDEYKGTVQTILDGIDSSLCDFAKITVIVDTPTIIPFKIFSFISRNLELSQIQNAHFVEDIDLG